MAQVRIDAGALISLIIVIIIGVLGFLAFNHYQSEKERRREEAIERRKREELERQLKQEQREKARKRAQERRMEVLAARKKQAEADRIAQQTKLERMQKNRVIAREKYKLAKKKEDAKIEAQRQAQRDRIKAAVEARNAAERRRAEAAARQAEEERERQRHKLKGDLASLKKSIPGLEEKLAECKKKTSAFRSRIRSSTSDRDRAINAARNICAKLARSYDLRYLKSVDPWQIYPTLFEQAKASTREVRILPPDDSQNMAKLKNKYDSAIGQIQKWNGELATATQEERKIQFELDNKKKMIADLEGTVGPVVADKPKPAEAPPPAKNKVQQPKCMLVLKNGQKVLALSVIDSGDSLAIKDEGGKIRIIKKADIAERKEME